MRIFGVEHEVRAHVQVLNAFSAHADKNDLMAFATACGTGTRRFFLVHGEPEQQDPLAAAMNAAGLRTTVPEPGQAVELE